MDRIHRNAAYTVAAWMSFASLSPAQSTKLHLETDVADSTAFDVTSTVIYGPTEAILVDGQFHASDARRVADDIAGKRLRLEAVIITHPDDDHFLGARIIQQRFPGTPVYISSAGLREFHRTGARALAGQRSYAPAEAPDSLAELTTLPTTHFTVDGEAVDVFTDRQGDHLHPTNSYVWIPSLRAVVAGDLVFNGVHVWLANSTAASRAAWRKSLAELAALHPRSVIAGHKRDAATPDTPDAIVFTRDYLDAFDGALKTATTSDDVIARMRARYPSLALPFILARAARVAIPD